jgi:hypothetical protein
MTYSSHYGNDGFFRYLRSNIHRYLRGLIFHRHLRDVLIGGLGFVARDPRLSDHGNDGLIFHRHLRGVLIGGLSFVARDPRLSDYGDDVLYSLLW